ncbi:hypothetical protein OSC27_12415 [Microbacterium sp. STN6]|uniref:hypothetical protein n=1 Tax=Microbacterium sp. STN6 TaxID=2995588 RepID=UPI002260F1AF|nr:hypothetical protein [Microbacterium sp. STN6]MCX7523075.1 hypothetical protein [Microbacterium sp. STN6]
MRAKAPRTSIVRRPSQMSRSLRRGTFTEQPELNRGRGLLWATTVVAMLYAGLQTIGSLGSALVTLLAPTVSVALPVQEFWPKLKPSVHITDGPTAHVIGGGISSAEVSVSGLNTASRVWLAAGDVLVGITGVIIAASIAAMCLRLLRGGVLGNRVVRSLFLASGTLAVCGIAWQICYSIGDASASRQVLQVTGWSIADSERAGGISEIGWPGPSSSFQVQFWPLAIALALAAVGVALRHSTLLRHERDAAIQRARALRRDVDGLV